MSVSILGLQSQPIAILTSSLKIDKYISFLWTHLLFCNKGVVPFSPDRMGVATLIGIIKLYVCDDDDNYTNVYRYIKHGYCPGF